jgi:hypothetical protein
MTPRTRPYAVLLAIVLASGPAQLSLGAGAGPQEQAVQAILETVRAFRIVYSKGVIEQVRKAGVAPSENWKTEDHSVMLNAQFVKAVGTEIEDFELGLVGVAPLYPSNRPKTQAEADALMKLQSNPDLKVLTFADGNQFKGLAADYAIVQGCADCHNAHPKSTKKNFKQGDLMGAIVVRIKK